MLPVFFVEQIGFGLEIADFGERKFDLPAIGGRLHGQVAPGSTGGGGTPGVGGDDFAASDIGAAEIGAETRRVFGLGAGFFFCAQREKDFVSDETQQAFAGGGGHDWRGCVHGGFLAERAGWENAKSDFVWVALAAAAI